MSNNQKTKIMSAVNSKAFLKLDKVIARRIGLNAAALLADLLSKRSYFVERCLTRVDGSFFNTSVNIEKDTCLGKKARRTATQRLVRAGFLSVRKEGLPSRNFYTIHDSVIAQVLSDNENNPVVAVGIPAVTAKGDANKNKGIRINPSSCPCQVSGDASLENMESGEEENGKQLGNFDFKRLGQRNYPRTNSQNRSVPAPIEPTIILPITHGAVATKHLSDADLPIDKVLALDEAHLREMVRSNRSQPWVLKRELGNYTLPAEAQRIICEAYEMETWEDVLEFQRELGRYVSSAYLHAFITDPQPKDSQQIVAHNTTSDDEGAL